MGTISDECSPFKSYGWGVGTSYTDSSLCIGNYSCQCWYPTGRRGIQNPNEEVESIVNSRPLSVNDLNDPEAPEPLTPNHLLTLKQKLVLPPPGKFQRADLYCRKWWRRVQYMANQFWFRWRREFLQNLQSRSKWTQRRRNMSVGDIVISKEDNGPRNQWPLAKVVEVYPSEDGCVRKVKILKADGELDNQGRRQKPPTMLERPIHKLVLLMPCDES